MQIFYTASYYGKKKYQRYYDAVLQALEKHNITVTSPEKGNYLDIVPHHLTKRLAKKPRLLHYEAIRRGIVAADAVVIEITREDFQLGHEATLAIQNQKPVLCLSLKEDFSQKIKNRYFYGAHYDLYNIDLAIADFLEKVQKELLSVRFNMFISPSQHQYLSTKAEESDKSMSEYIRGLIDKDKKLP